MLIFFLLSKSFHEVWVWKNRSNLFLGVPSRQYLQPWPRKRVTPRSPTGDAMSGSPLSTHSNGREYLTIRGKIYIDISWTLKTNRIILSCDCIEKEGRNVWAWCEQQIGASNRDYRWWLWRWHVPREGHDFISSHIISEGRGAFENSTIISKAFILERRNSPLYNYSSIENTSLPENHMNYLSTVFLHLLSCRYIIYVIQSEMSPITSVYVSVQYGKWRWFLF